MRRATQSEVVAILTGLGFTRAREGSGEEPGTSRLRYLKLRLAHLRQEAETTSTIPKLREYFRSPLRLLTWAEPPPTHHAQQQAAADDCHNDGVFAMPVAKRSPHTSRLFLKVVSAIAP
jgi:hypothetical protein